MGKEVPRRQKETQRLFGQDLQDGRDFSEVRHLAALLCDGPGKPDWHCVRCGAPTKQSFAGTHPRRAMQTKEISHRGTETQSFPTGFAGWTGLGFRRRGGRKSEELRAVRRGRHGGNGIRRGPGSAEIQIGRGIIPVQDELHPQFGILPVGRGIFSLQANGNGVSLPRLQAHPGNRRAPADISRHAPGLAR